MSKHIEEVVKSRMGIEVYHIFVCGPSDGHTKFGQPTVDCLN